MLEARFAAIAAELKAAISQDAAARTVQQMLTSMETGPREAAVIAALGDEYREWLQIYTDRMDAELERRGTHLDNGVITY